MAYNDTTSPFIDAHCHLFNIMDVPLYESILGTVHMGTIQKLIVAIGLGAANLPERLKTYRNFIRFFERDIITNIQWLEQEIKTAVKGDNDTMKDLKAFGYDRKRIIVTPLIMDFDTNVSQAEIGGDVLCTDQFKRLTDAIINAKSELEIYPFAGFALDKLDKDDQKLVEFKNWWDNNSLSADLRRTGKSSKLPLGKAIGIKLYPPLGFNPYSDNGPVRSRYLSFFKWCIEKDIPITVHCQESSFTATQQVNQLNNRTHPNNWERLLEENPDLLELRINFGHFGGSAQLDKMMDEVNQQGSGQSLQNNWTQTICRILCKYPNAYADVSAFGFENIQTQKNLARILGCTNDSSSNTSLPSLKALRDKIIWGSDVPMVIASPSFLDPQQKPSYLSLLDRFRKGLCVFSSGDEFRYALEIFSRVTRTNPANFLFGSV